MSGEEFEAALVTLFGAEKWRREAPIALEISVDTMDRYRAKGPIPIAKVAVRLLLAEHERKEAIAANIRRVQRMAKERRT